MQAAATQTQLSVDEIGRAKTYLTQAENGAMGAIHGLSSAQWTFRPAPDGWSIAEIMEHVTCVQEGLAQIEDLDGTLDQYYLLHAARADLLRRLDRADEAAEAYRRAERLGTNEIERDFLRRRLQQVLKERAS